MGERNSRGTRERERRREAERTTRRAFRFRANCVPLEHIHS